VAENQLFDYSALVDRPPLRLPNGARIAVWVGINIERWTFFDAVIDQFDVLYEEGAESGRIMAIPLHPFVTGSPSGPGISTVPWPT
jgi:hypothetical protein